MNFDKVHQQMGSCDEDVTHFYTIVEGRKSLLSVCALGHVLGMCSAPAEIAMFDVSCHRLMKPFLS